MEERERILGFIADGIQHRRQHWAKVTSTADALASAAFHLDNYDASKICPTCGASWLVADESLIGTIWANSAK